MTEEKRWKLEAQCRILEKNLETFKEFKEIKNPEEKKTKLKEVYRNTSNLIFDNTFAKEFRISPYIIEQKNGIRPKGSKSMPEHIYGRDNSAYLILNYMDKNSMEKISPEELVKLLKQFSPTLSIRKLEKLHTELNFRLKSFQKNGITFDQYNTILDELGYNSIPEEYRSSFNSYLEFFEKCKKEELSS